MVGWKICTPLSITTLPIKMYLAHSVAMLLCSAPFSTVMFGWFYFSVIQMNILCEEYKYLGFKMYIIRHYVNFIHQDYIFVFIHDLICIG